MVDRTEPSPFVFRNNNAVSLWVIMPLWLGGLGCFTYFYVRQHTPFGVGRVLSYVILGGLWLFGVGGAAWAFMQPRSVVSVVAGGVLVREVWLWRVRERRYAAADVLVPDVDASTDNDGAPYFKCLLWLPNPGGKTYPTRGCVVTVAEGHQRPQIEAAHRHLLAALSQARAAPTAQRPAD